MMLSKGIERLFQPAIAQPLPRPPYESSKLFANSFGVILLVIFLVIIVAVIIYLGWKFLKSKGN